MNLNKDLIGYWPLHQDTLDHSPVRHTTRSVDVELGFDGPHGEPDGAARFNGHSSLLEIADHPALHLHDGEFSIAAWIFVEPKATDVVGSIISKFDDTRRRGFHLYALTSSGVTSTAQPNYRHLHFGVDNGWLEPRWQDCGRPGNAVKVSALTVSKGELYAGTFEFGANEHGRLFRYAGGQNWVDLGNPLGCNAIQSVVEFNGSLYCGTGRYIAAGSHLGETLNTTPGGKVFRVTPDGQWIDCGHPGHEDATPEHVPATGFATGKADDVIALTVYRGELYCVSNHRCGVFKYLGGKEWKYIGPDNRIMTLAIYRGKLYALFNGGAVYRYEGDTKWTDCGCPKNSTQTYSAVVHRGRLYVGTWPDGAVYCYEGGKEWRPVGGTGRVEQENEIMGMALYNGKVYLGSLPSANVYRMDGESFTNIGNLDNSPVELRRVWSMAIYQGRLFAGTLPSGRVHSIEAGKMATADRTLRAGWHHIAAVRERRQLKLYVDAQLVAVSSPLGATAFDLTNAEPLHIGFGAYEYFDGLMSGMRLYTRALNQPEISALYAPPVERGGARSLV